MRWLVSSDLIKGDHGALVLAAPSSDKRRPVAMSDTHSLPKQTKLTPLFQGRTKATPKLSGKQYQALLSVFWASCTGKRTGGKSKGKGNQKRGGGGLCTCVWVGGVCMVLCVCVCVLRGGRWGDDHVTQVVRSGRRVQAVFDVRWSLQVMLNLACE